MSEFGLETLALLIGPKRTFHIALGRIKSQVSQVRKVFGKMKTSKGCGNDGIASCFLKIALPVISESLCEMFNLSIATGCFRDSWKIARVAPIFKSREPDDRSNYRPISVLPVLARVFEKLIHNQLIIRLFGCKQTSVFKPIWLQGSSFCCHVPS